MLLHACMDHRVQGLLWGDPTNSDRHQAARPTRARGSTILLAAHEAAYSVHYINALRWSERHQICQWISALGCTGAL